MWILFVLGAIAGVAFPAFLITAIQKPENENARILSCVCFGVAVLAVLVLAWY